LLRLKSKEVGARGRSHGPSGKSKEAGSKSLLRLKSKEVKENQILIDFWIKIGLEIE
jgi:hypothetical protein